MSGDYLSEKAKFRCMAGVEIKVKHETNAKVFYQGKKLLTKSASLEPTPGATCPILTASAGGSPQLCQVKIMQWTNLSKNTVCGKQLLCSMPIPTVPCTTCVGAVPPQPIFLVDTGVKSHVVSGSVPADLVVNDKPPKETSTQQTSKTSFQTPNSLTIDNAVMSGINDKKLSHQTNTNGIQSNVQGKKSAVVLSDDKIPSEAHGCDNCNQRKSCGFFEKLEEVKERNKTNASLLKYEGNASKLKVNYEEKGYPDGDHYLKMLEQYKNANWTYAAHHILSSNQVVAKKENLDLVAMLNYRNININDARNAIMLSTILQYDLKKSLEERDNKDQEKQAAKRVTAFEVMSYTGLQWHVGSHDYPFSEQEEKHLREMIHRYRWKREGEGVGKSDEIKSYAVLLCQEMGELKRKYFAQGKCPRDVADQFEIDFWNMAKRIYKKLNAFSKHSRESYPYYVSKSAYLFAFSMPITSKLMLIWPSEKGVYAQKFRVEKFNADHQNRQFNAKANMVNFKTIKGQYAESYYFKTESDKNKFIEYCENIQYFLFAGEASIKDLPFSTEVYDGRIRDAHRPKGNDGTEFLNRNEMAIVEWLRQKQEQAKDVYIAPLKMIKERRDEYLKGCQ